MAFAVQQDDGGRAALPADSTAAQPDTPQMSAADLSAVDMDAAMCSGDVTAVTKQLASAVIDVEAATAGEFQPDAPADPATEGDAAALAAAAAAATAAAAEEQQSALEDTPIDEMHSDELTPIDRHDDGASDAE
jgi:hypothetical protein